MIASMSGRPWRAARITEFGLPPTATQVGRSRSSTGWSDWSFSGARVVPDQVIGSRDSAATSRSSFSSKSVS